MLSCCEMSEEAQASAGAGVAEQRAGLFLRTVHLRESLAPDSPWGQKGQTVQKSQCDTNADPPANPNKINASTPTVQLAF